MVRYDERKQVLWVSRRDTDSLKTLAEKLDYSRGKNLVSNRVWTIGLGGYDMGYFVGLNKNKIPEIQYSRDSFDDVLEVNYEYKEFRFNVKVDLDTAKRMLKAMDAENFEDVSEWDWVADLEGEYERRDESHSRPGRMLKESASEWFDENGKLIKEIPEECLADILDAEQNATPPQRNRIALRWVDNLDFEVPRERVLKFALRVGIEGWDELTDRELAAKALMMAVFNIDDHGEWEGLR